jgi:thiol:disulfide interchange protein
VEAPKTSAASYEVRWECFALPAHLFSLESPLKSFFAPILLAVPLMAQAPVTWETDLSVALKRARAEKKPVLLDLWADWCPDCHRFADKVVPAPEVQTVLRKTIPVAIMVSTKEKAEVAEHAELIRRFQVHAYPTLVILDTEGREVRRKVTGKWTPDMLVSFLQTP